jgi:hypothetical protein
MVVFHCVIRDWNRGFPLIQHHFAQTLRPFVMAIYPTQVVRNIVQAIAAKALSYCENITRKPLIERLDSLNIQ